MKLLRHPILLSFLLLAALPGCGQPEKEYHFGGTVKTVYSYNSRGQLHGIIRHYDEMTRLWKEETWQDGKKQGPTLVYGGRGQVISRVQFVDDEEHGIYRTYYDNGTLRAQYVYDRGVLNGPFIKFFKSGRPEAEGVYVQGSKHGSETLYYPSGRPRASAYYTAGAVHCPVIEFYESGMVSLVASYRNDKLDGISKKYFEDGKIKSEMLFENGKNMITVEYDEAGAVTGGTESKTDFNFLKKMRREMPAFRWN